MKVTHIQVEGRWSYSSTNYSEIPIYCLLGNKIFIHLMEVLENRNLQSIKPCLFDIIKVGEDNKYMV